MAVIRELTLNKTSVKFLREMYQSSGLEAVVSYHGQRREAGCEIDAAVTLAFAAEQAHLVIQNEHLTVLVEMKAGGTYRIYFYSKIYHQFAQFNVTEPVQLGYRAGMDMKIVASEATVTIDQLIVEEVWSAGFDHRDSFSEFQRALRNQHSALKRYFEFIVN